ncbi:UNVERIFIED_CONTAM: hypothetical protein PYX00_011682 [Menopon gallinae]|uniref:hydroxyacylglutathione hydrolase n=1 Tax=Menopon gallinae TaxID=328185 RepID=A0AAW2H8E2_9NEOP
MNFTAIRALKDNYMFLLYNDEEAISVDPLHPSLVLEALSRNLTKEHYECMEDLKREDKCAKRRLVYNLTTHNHLDHTGGNKDLAELSPETVFVSGFGEDWYKDDGPNKKVCKDGDVIKEKSFEIHCIHTSCHTRDSFCFLINAGERRFLLTGDTIFFLGCGRFFEGDGSDMAESIKKIIRIVPDDAVLLYGHDYNASGLKFSKTCCSQIDVPEEIEDKRFLTLGEEKIYNPFVRAAMGSNAGDKIQKLRETKNRFEDGCHGLFCIYTLIAQAATVRMFPALPVDVAFLEPDLDTRNDRRIQRKEEEGFCIECVKKPGTLVVKHIAKYINNHLVHIFCVFPLKQAFYKPPGFLLGFCLEAAEIKKKLGRNDETGRLIHRQSLDKVQDEIHGGF